MLEDQNVLHIVDGDSAAEALAEAGIEGDMLNWLDVLHDGPVRGELSREARLDERARFLSSQGWTSYQDAYDRLAMRYEVLDGSTHDVILLWYGPELFDQLQLLEPVAVLTDYPALLRRTRLAHLGESVPMSSPGTLHKAASRARVLSEAQIELARAAWRVFSGTSRADLEAFCAGSTQALPHLGAALERMLEELPGDDGLSRTERATLELAADGPAGPADLFADLQDQETVPFMGDSSYWQRLKNLCEGPKPLLATADGAPFFLPRENPPEDGFTAQQLILTDACRAVLAGTAVHTPTPGILGGIRYGAA